MSKLSGKQLAMSWINNQLAPERIQLTKEDFEAIQGGPISDKAFEQAVKFTKDKLAKVRTPFSAYVTKYCSGETPSDTPPVASAESPPDSAAPPAA